MGQNKYAYRFTPAAVPCAICQVRLSPGSDEHLHMERHHKKENTQRIGEILWLTPHEAVYAGRHYRPEGD